VDQTVGNILTFAIGMFSVDSDEVSIKWFLEKFMDKCSVLRKCVKTLVCEMDVVLIKTIEMKFPKAKLIISHHSVIEEFKKI